MKHTIQLFDGPLPKINVSIYPDSQVNVILDDIVADDEYTIHSRFSSYQDLFKILATVDVLRNAGVDRINLYCPYVLSARSDRRFKSNQSFDLKIVCKILNDCNFNKITVVDAHSDVLPALLDKCVNISAWDGWIKNIGMNPYVSFDWKDKILVSPDAGAYKKIFHIGEQTKCEIVTGNKVRLADGTPDVVIHGDVNGRDCVIVDDICDGGRTFENLGQKLKDLAARSVTLFVTHGIFSKGTALSNIDMIYTTNSFQQFKEQTKQFIFFNIF